MRMDANRPDTLLRNGLRTLTITCKTNVKNDLQIHIQTFRKCMVYV